MVLVDDSCDTIAPYLDGEPVARFSDLATTSFYGSHIITALGFGGMVFTNDRAKVDKITVLRDWGRIGGDVEDFDKRFGYEIDGIPYDHKFLYSEMGYNLKLNESAAAFGLEQVKRLPGFLHTRKINFITLKSFFANYEEFFHLPEVIPGADTNWLAFPLTIKEGAPFSRYDFLKHMESKGIQTRVLFSGNVTRHPAYQKADFRVYGQLKNADYVMARGLLLGCHQGMGLEDLGYVTQTANEFLANYR